MPWFLPLERGARGAARLYAFPHAGSGPSSMGALARRLGGDVEVWSVNLPGRQSRLAEPPRTDLAALVAILADDLGERSAGPFALFGYCSGALLAYLVARALAGAGRAPRHLFVASFAAPDVALLARRLHRLPSDRFWERLPVDGGLAPELAAREDLRPVFEPALRGDFALLAGYRHAAGAPLAVPITVLAGRDDTSLTRGSVLGWRRQTTHPLVVRDLATSHWLLEEAPGDVAGVIAGSLGTDEGGG